MREGGGREVEGRRKRRWIRFNCKIYILPIITKCGYHFMEVAKTWNLEIKNVNQKFKAFRIMPEQITSNSNLVQSVRKERAVFRVAC